MACQNFISIFGEAIDKKRSRTFSKNFYEIYT